MFKLLPAARRHHRVWAASQGRARLTGKASPARWHAASPIHPIPTPTAHPPTPVQVTREVFEASKGRLKVVGRAGVGIDNVDLAAASEYGCLVVNAPTANTVAAAEHGIALLCALARNVSQADAAMKDGR